MLLIWKLLYTSSHVHGKGCLNKREKKYMWEITILRHCCIRSNLRLNMKIQLMQSLNLRISYQNNLQYMPSIVCYDGYESNVHFKPKD